MSAVAPNQPPSSRRELARRWQRVKTPLYVLAWCMAVILFAILSRLDGAIRNRVLQILVSGALLIYLSTQLVSASRAVRSLPIAGWIVRLALTCVYAFFLGLIGMCLVGLAFFLGIWPDAVSLAFLLSLLLAGAGLTLGLLSLIVFGIVGAVRWEMRVSAEERCALELRAEEVRSNGPRRP